MTLTEFLEINELNLESATTLTDRNENGQTDLFSWDLDNDEIMDIVIDINEEVRGESHRTTQGFNTIIVFNHVKKKVWIVDVGGSSGEILMVRKQSL
jgi:hypothetical protein